MSRFLKILIIGVLLVAVPFSYALAGNFVKSFTSVADEAGGLGNVKCSTLGSQDGAGIVYLSTGIEYWFYDHTATDAADGTHVRCKGYTAAGVWEQVKDEITPVSLGGTGAATFTDGGILLGSGTGPFTALGAAANGQIPIGDGTTDPVLANITETGDALVVANGPGTITLSAQANVEAVADACEGSTSPGVDFYYSLNDGADETCGTGDKLSGSVTSTCPDYDTGDNEDNEDCDLTFWSMDATVPDSSVKTSRAKFTATDGGGGSWDLMYPVTAPSVNTGVEKLAYTAASDLESLDPNGCRRYYHQGGVGSDTQWEMHHSGICPDSTTAMRDFDIWNNDTSETLILNPDGDDKFIIAGTGACSNGERLEIEPVTYVKLIGVNVSNWLAICSPIANCACIAGVP